MKFFTFAGFSGAGKTTLIEKVIQTLSLKGYKIAAVKHDGHSFTMDKEGKDTYRFKNAGAKAIAITSNSKYALIADCKERKSFDELLDLLPKDIELVIGEGFKDENIEKILVHRTGIKEIKDINERNIVAYVTDNIDNFKGKQNVFNIDDLPSITEFLINKYLK